MEVQEELVTHLLAAHNISVLNSTWHQYGNGTMQVSHQYQTLRIPVVLLRSFVLRPPESPHGCAHGAYGVRTRAVGQIRLGPEEPRS
jgi:hypothetical protein